MYCPVCGKPLPDEARFCDRCGAMLAPQPAPVQQAPPVVKQAGGKRSAVFGILMLIMTVLYEVLEIVFRVMFARILAGESMPFFAALRMMTGTLPQMILRVFGLAAMILIAVYHMAGYPNRKLYALGAVGAILMAVAKIPLRGNLEWTIACILILTGSVLLAVYWFMKEKPAALGIAGSAVCLAGTLFYLLSDLIGVGGSVLITMVVLTADLLLITYWIFVLVATAAGRKKTV